MAARFVYRVDDVVATMHWREFWRFLDLFRRHGVQPLLGVVPDNKDPGLQIEPEDPAFWGIIRGLVDDGSVEVAQHGFQHLYESKRHGLLGWRLGFPPRSEFAGLPYPSQLEKIRQGRRILTDHGIASEVWMAPAHTFDRNTLQALRETGFRAITDGISLYPFERDGLVFVPQQLWEPRAVPVGVWTICLHLHRQNDELYQLVKSHLESGARVISFGEARTQRKNLIQGVGNVLFEGVYSLHILRHRTRRLFGRGSKEAAH